MDAVRITRLVRTASSEIYLLWIDEDRVGQIDLHYADATIYATVLLEKPEAIDQDALVAQLDDELVSSYSARFERENFVVTIFQAHEVGRCEDPMIDSLEEFEEGDDEPLDDDEE